MVAFRIPSLLLAAALAAGPTAAFMPRATVRTTTTARNLGVDPSVFQDLHTTAASVDFQHLSDAMSSSMTFLADGADAAVAEVAKKDNGWFGFLTEPISLLLQGIHSGLTAVGFNANGWGSSIIALTILIKVLTFPLTKTQLESTNKMQALQPAIKEVQAKYQSNPEVMNQKIAELYQTNEVNPLAGCLPSFVQIPVFIGLYRAVLDLAQQNKLDEPFLFLPNLEGPTYGADPAHGTDWLFQGWIDGAPALGWPDTIAFMALPIFLVVSQFVSMELMQPKDSPTSNNAVLKILPVMIGWFALNVPAALSVYWVINNIVTTVTTLAIRNSMDLTPVAAGGGSATASAPEPIFAPPREKPAGFGDATSAASMASAGVKPLSSNVMDAEVVQEDDMEAVTEAAGTGMGEGEGKKQRGKKKKKKKN